MKQSVIESLGGMALAGLVALFPWSASAVGPVQVAVTIDDLPWNGILPEGESPEQAIGRIAAVLRVHGAPATGFVVCDHALQYELAIRTWAAWGLKLGNHTARHADLNRVPVPDWLDDVARCHDYLDRFGTARTPYFRYPLLHEGPTVAVRDAARSGLEGLGLRNAHVSVDTSEWLLASAYGDALRAGDGARRLAIGREFQRHILAAVEHADAVARRKLDRRIPLVLLLHANSLVADHLDGLLLALRARGIEFIELETALEDPAYALPDEYAGPKGLSWLYRMRPLSLDDLAWDDGEAAAIQARFAAREPGNRPSPSPVSHARLAAAAPEGLASVLHFASSSERMRSLLVMHRGALHAEAYFNGAGPDRPQNLKSISKTLVSALTGIALDRGWISDIDDSIARYLPEYFENDRFSDKAGITVRELLTMSSGLADADYGQIQHSTDWTEMILDQPITRDGQPAFSYGTPIVNLLSEILVRTSGLSLTGIANRDLLGPLGGEIAYWRTDSQGVELGGNDAYLLPRDLLRVGELYRNGGIHAGRRILDEDFIRQSTTRRITPPDPTVNHGTVPIRGYGYLWWLPDIDDDAAYAALGHGGQVLLVLPCRELVVVMTSRWPGASSVEHYLHLAQVLNEKLLPLYPVAACKPGGNAGPIVGMTWNTLGVLGVRPQQGSHESPERNVSGTPAG